jgi:hypothetical protein
MAIRVRIKKRPVVEFKRTQATGVRSRKECIRDAAQKIVDAGQCGKKYDVIWDIIREVFNEGRCQITYETGQQVLAERNRILESRETEVTSVG